jgi:hypothetical protein
VSDAWVTFAAALGGALTGGAASAIGSVWLQHRNERRRWRSELFKARIPHLVSVLEHGVSATEREEFWPAGELFNELDKGATWRTAVLASKRDHRRLRKIRNELRRARDLEAELNVSGHDDSRDYEYRAAAANERLIAREALKKALAYERWLRKKLG